MARLDLRDMFKNLTLYEETYEMTVQPGREIVSKELGEAYQYTLMMQQDFPLELLEAITHGVNATSGSRGRLAKLRFELNQGLESLASAERAIYALIREDERYVQGHSLLLHHYFVFPLGSSYDILRPVLTTDMQLEALHRAEIPRSLISQKDRKAMCGRLAESVLNMLSRMQIISAELLHDAETLLSFPDDVSHKEYHPMPDEIEQNLGFYAEPYGTVPHRPFHNHSFSLQEIRLRIQVRAWNLYHDSKAELKVFRDTKTDFLNCLHEYRRFLDTVKEHRGIELTYSMLPSPTRESSEVLSSLNSSVEFLASLYERYASFNMTKLDLFKDLDHAKVLDIMQPLKSASSMVEQHWISPFQARLRTLSQWLTGAYTTGIRHVVAFQQYFSQHEARGLFLRRARALRLWRHPRAHLTREQVLHYGYTERQGETMVPTNMEGFLNTTANSTIKVYMYQLHTN